MGENMKVWKIDKNVDEYAGFYLLRESEKFIIEEKVDRGNELSEWNEIEVTASDIYKPLGDCPHLWSGGYSLIVSDNVKKLFGDKYKKYIQLLPLLYKGQKENYYLVNTLSIIDSIDYEKSELEIILNKYIVDVKKYFFTDAVRSMPIFKIYLDGVVKISTFVNDELKDLIESNGLQGFRFTEVFEFTD